MCFVFLFFSEVKVILTPRIETYHLWVWFYGWADLESSWLSPLSVFGKLPGSASRKTSTVPCQNSSSLKHHLPLSIKCGSGIVWRHFEEGPYASTKWRPRSGVAGILFGVNSTTVWRMRKKYLFVVIICLLPPRRKHRKAESQSANQSLKRYTKTTMWHVHTHTQTQRENVEMEETKTNADCAMRLSSNQFCTIPLQGDAGSESPGSSFFHFLSELPLLSRSQPNHRHTQGLVIKTIIITETGAFFHLHLDLFLSVFSWVPCHAVPGLFVSCT